MKAADKGPMGFNENAVRHYAHFDHKVSYSKVKALVEDPDYVAHHGFLPLITKTIVKSKYNGKSVETKDRKVCYASHTDRCIYQRYAFLLNQRYNEYVAQHNVNHAAIAYRNNLGKSNIDFAHTAFSKIARLGECRVLVADFKGFFDSLDYAILKKRLRLLLGGPLPDDYYAVYKSVIRYSTWDLEDLMKLHGLDSSKRKDLQAFNDRALALSKEQFRSHVKESVEFPWKERGCGIPQGLPISGVLANIFMLEFDEKMARLAETDGGLYMRYSDDIILIAPNQSSFEACLDELRRLCDEHKLTIEPNKTSKYAIENGIVRHCDDASGKPTKVQYLGFDFDGQSVRIRQRTIGGYYAKMHRMAKWAFYDYAHPSLKRVRKYYQRFSSKGQHIGHGNFLSYSKRAEKRFRIKGVRNEIGRDTAKHYLKMKRMPKKISKTHLDNWKAHQELAAQQLKRK